MRKATYGLYMEILLCVVLVSAAGCGGATEQDYRIETLDTGVIQTTYTSLTLKALTVDTVAVWDVWSGEGSYLFNRLTTVAGIEDGFYILDSGNRQVVEVDLEGRMRNVFGQRGKGPGEFGFPRFLNVLNEEVWVGDIMPMRFSLFSRDGAFRRTISSRARLSPNQDRCAVLSDGQVLNSTDALDGHLSLLRWNLEEGTCDTLATMQSLPEVIIELHRPDGSIIPFDTRPAYASELHWSYNGRGRLLTVTSSEYVFEERNTEGGITRRTIAPTPDLTVTEREREHFLAHVAFGTGDGTRISNEEIRRRWKFAEKRQAIGGIRIDPFGRIWVLAHTGDIEKNRIDVFDSDHLYLGSLPALMLPMAFSSEGIALFRVPEGPHGEGFYFTAQLP